MSGERSGDIVLSAKRIFLWLSIGAGIVILSGLFSNLAKFFLPDLSSLSDPSSGTVILLKAFNLDSELNVPTWFAAFLLAANGGLLGLLGASLRKKGLRDGRLWGVLGVIFLLLSLDEIATFHEHLGQAVGLVLELEDGRFSWVLVAIPLVALLGFVYLGALMRLPRRHAWMIVIAGAIYVGGAVGAEVLGWIYQSHAPGESPGYVMLTWAEEAAEFTGQLLFSHALLDLLAMYGVGFRFRN